jgi:hypothetical protein
MDGTVDFHFPARKTKVNDPAGNKFRQIQLPPTVQPDPAELSEDDVGFTLPVWPEFRDLCCEVGIRRTEGGFNHGDDVIGSSEEAARSARLRVILGRGRSYCRRGLPANASLTVTRRRWFRQVLHKCCGLSISVALSGRLVPRNNARYSSS